MNDILARLRQHGCQGRIVSTSHLGDLRAEIDKRHQTGLLDENLYRSNLAFFEFQKPPEFPEANSLISIAIPRPQTQGNFTYRGRVWKFIVPPTYSDYGVTSKRAEALLNEILNPIGFRVARGKLPEKTLAAHSGLCFYGKNNITFAPTMGSFLQLASFYSNIVVEEDTWQEMKMMPECESCTKCVRACPTRAITNQRFLIHAERCLTYFNEDTAEFPAWIDESWHNCLVGCMICQKVCPGNENFVHWIGEQVEFSEEETNLISRSNALAELGPGTIKKIQRLIPLNSDDVFRVIARNLRVLLD